MEQAMALMQGDPIMLALPLFLLMVVLESAYSARRGLGWYKQQDFFGSMGVLMLTILVDLLPKLLCIMFMFALYEITPLNGVMGREWWSWLLLFLLDDFIYYWFHRANHEVRLLWAGHVNHHSSQYMNFGTALRQGVGERVHKYFFWLPLPLIGFEPAMVLTMMGISLFYQFWIHTRAIEKLHPLLELIFNTPSHHRVHHGSNIRYLDCNHGGTLIIWDRLFGTFSEELESEPVVYGLTHNIDTYNPIKIVLHEYRQIIRDCRAAGQWRDRIRYLLLSPGWHPEGPDERARTLRKQAGISI